MTNVLSLLNPHALDQALALLRASEPIAFPTDTVYGVGAAVLDPAAVLRLYAVKRRPLAQAIPVLIADQSDLTLVATEVTPLAWRLTRLWPGGLTLVVAAAPHLPAELLAGGTSVAVRLPDHDWLRALMRRLGAPLAATSANIPGGRDPQTAAEVVEQLGDALPLVLDGGPTPGPVPSTIVDCTGARPRRLRGGALPWARVVAEVE